MRTLIALFIFALLLSGCSSSSDDTGTDWTIYEKVNVTAWTSNANKANTSVHASIEKVGACSILNYSWSLASGDGLPWFEYPYDRDSVVVFPANGSYVLRFNVVWITSSGWRREENIYVPFQITNVPIAPVGTG